MNPIFTNIIINKILKTKKRKENLSQEQELESARIFFVRFKYVLKDVLLITLGVFSAAFGFKGFLLTNNFIDGGATGIALLFSKITFAPLWVLIVIVNFPFIILAKKAMGKAFAIKTVLSISALAFVLAFINFPNITNDNLLVAVFGGFFLGAGIGLTMRGGAVIDGTEVLAIFLSKKTGSSVGDIIIFINVIIFGVAVYFLGVENALYSMITYLSASKTLDFLMEGIEENTAVTIVSDKSEEVKKMILATMESGVTVFKGTKGLSKNINEKDTEIIYTVLSRLEIGNFKQELEKIDPEAFVIMTRVKDTVGGTIKKRISKRTH
ncbi:MAG: YitT family protein [Bacteroidetes bacterium]|nr:YitT family protein [Bacteroidota bacterium]